MAVSTIPAVVATPRSGKFNKNAARRVRVSGQIPAVVYGAGQDSVAVAVDPKIITRILHSDSGHNTIFDLDISGSPTVKAMIVDWQHEPIKGKLLHIDLKRIAMDKKLTVNVPIELVGEPAGVKQQGGILEQIAREVEVECLPGDIPNEIELNVSELVFGTVLRISDLPKNDKVKYLSDPEQPVAHIITIKEEEVPAADAVAGEAAAAPAEPEVIKKGKQETAEEGTAEPAKAEKAEKKEKK
jgi:large subunit ribosomal protein L25